MPLNPDSHDRLRALYKRFDRFPEAKFLKDGGAVLKRDAYVAFLDARQLIDALAQDLWAETKGWRPIATFFEEDAGTPTVLLWAVLPETGEPGVTLGYWDDDSQAWFRECEGACDECAPIEPTKWMAVAELMRAADDREFVAIDRGGIVR